MKDKILNMMKKNKSMVGKMEWCSKISFFRKSVGKHKSFLAHDVRKYWWIYTVKTSIWPDQACPNIELQFSEAYQCWICIDSRFKVIRALKKNDQSSKVTSAQSGHGFFNPYWQISETVLLENSSIKKSWVPIHFFKPGGELDRFTGKLIQKKAVSRK